MMKTDELIHLQNPWFRDGGYLPRELAWQKRAIFSAFFHDICELKQAQSLVGLRRVGKSTVLKQAIGELLKAQKVKNHVLYFSFDEPLVAGQTETLENVINYYLKHVLQKEVHEIKEKVYLFFDEIQLIPFWQDIVKRFYDVNQNLKFVVSGSSSLFIRKNSAESLAGRIFEKYLTPLTFDEYQTFSGRCDLIEFLKVGQFPEILEINDYDKKIDYLKEGVVRKVIEIDMPRVHPLKKQFNFERLFWSLLPNTGQIIESSKLMTDLQIKKASLFNYLNLLEDSLLFNKTLNLSGSFRSEKRLLRKFYPASSNFLSLIPDNIQIGFVAECYAASILKQTHKNLFLFNRSGKEIDFVLPDEKTAIEVKFQENIRLNDYQFLKKYCQEKQYQGIVVTKNQIPIEDTSIKFIPLAEFGRTR